jgi:hypothetical protein
LTWKPAPESLPPLIDPRSPATRLWTVNAVAGPDGLEVALTYAGGHYDERTAQTLADAVVDHLRELVDAWDEAGGLGSAPDRCPPTVAGRPGLEAALAKAIARAPRRVAAEQPTGPS